MLRFAEAIPSEEIVSAVRRQLSWTHIKTLIYIDDPLKRDFYLQMCQQEGWSTRTLQDRLDSQLFERTALSRQPEQLLEQELATLRQTGTITPAWVLKDPYVLDFLGLQRPLPGKRPGRRHPARAGKLPAGAGRRLHLRRPAKAPPDRQRRFLHRPAALQPPPEKAGGD
jgi:hypothetical protein